MRRCFRIRWCFRPHPRLRFGLLFRACSRLRLRLRLALALVPLPPFMLASSSSPSSSSLNGSIRVPTISRAALPRQPTSAQFVMRLNASASEPFTAQAVEASMRAGKHAITSAVSALAGHFSGNRAHAERAKRHHEGKGVEFAQRARVDEHRANHAHADEQHERDRYEIDTLHRA